MNLLRTTMFLPPGGRWFYRLAARPEVEFSSEKSLREVEYRTLEFCRLNKVTPPPNLFEEIQDYMCQRLPPGSCSRPPSGRRAGWGFFEILKVTEEGLCAPKLAERANETLRNKQALVCRTCPENSLSRCSSCSGLRSTALSRVGAKPSALDDYLGICESTGCVLAGLTWLTPDAARTRFKPEELPPTCWMAKTQPK